MTQEGLRDRKKREVRERLYARALDLFRARGFESVTVSEICQAAGVAKGTFFNHFPTKDHLLLEWYERLTAGANAAEIGEGPLEARLMTLARGFFDACLADADLWRAKQQRVGLDADFRAAERSSDLRTLAKVEAIFTEALARGEISGTVPPADLAELYLAVMTGTSREWALAEGGFDFVAALERRTKNFVSGLARSE